ncbi:MAG: 50S ribosomal protein L25/general stress protein Ctc [Myxococcota bacterium]
MERQTLQAEVREERGKGPARRLRKRGLVPAVFYGPETEPTPIAVSPKDVVKVLQTEYGRNTVVKIALDGGREELVICKDLEVDPVTRDILHVDFYRVEPGREVEVEVPFRTKGRAVGVQKGGTLHVTLRVLPVRCTPDKIPATIEVDVAKMEIGDVLRVQDIPLPEGVQVMRAGHRTLATVMAEERRAADDAAEEAAGEGEAPAAS